MSSTLTKYTLAPQDITRIQIWMRKLLPEVVRVLTDTGVGFSWLFTPLEPEISLLQFNPECTKVDRLADLEITHYNSKETANDALRNIVFGRIRLALPKKPAKGDSEQITRNCCRLSVSTAQFLQQTHYFLGTPWLDVRGASQPYVFKVDARIGNEAPLSYFVFELDHPELLQTLFIDLSFCFAIQRVVDKQSGKIVLASDRLS